MSNNPFGAANGSVNRYQEHDSKSTQKVCDKTSGVNTVVSAVDGSSSGNSSSSSSGGQSGPQEQSEEEDCSASTDETNAKALLGASAQSDVNTSARLAGLQSANVESNGGKEEIETISGEIQDPSKENIASDMKDMNLHDEFALARRLSLASDDSNEQDEWDFNLDEDPFMGLTPFDEGYMDLHDRAELSMWRMPENFLDREDSAQSASNQKRVRFQEDVDVLVDHPDSSSSSDEESDDDAFPDLFMAQDDPLLQRRLGALEREDIDATFQIAEDSDTASVWDWDGADEQLAFKLLDNDDESEAESRSDADSDYDSGDELDGDKTDEETEEDQEASLEQLNKSQPDIQTEPAAAKRDMPPPQKPADKSVIARPTSSKSQTNVRPTTPGSGQPPRAGTFILDPTRASLHSNGNKIHCRPPVTPLEKEREFWERHASAANSRNTSPRSSFSWNMTTPVRADRPARPLTTQSTLRTMFDGNLDHINNDDIEDEESPFEHFPSLAPAMHLSYASNSLHDDSDIEIEDVNMGDFMHVDDTDSETEGTGGPSSAVTSPGQSSSFFSPFSPSSAAQRNQGAGDNLLAHLNRSRGVVGSFRRNQYQAKAIGSMASHPAVRASTSEMNAMQKGRRHAGNTPMTPARKKRGTSQDIGLTNSGVRKSYTGAASSPVSNRSPVRRRGHSFTNFSPSR